MFCFSSSFVLETPPVEDHKLSTVQNVLIHEIVRLLKWYSKVRPIIPQLGSVRVMKMLLKTTKGISYCSTSDNISIMLEILEYEAKRKKNKNNV